MKLFANIALTLAAILLVAMTLLIGADVVMRYVLADPIFGAQDLVKAFLVCIIGLSLADAWLSESNVSMTIVHDRLPKPARTVIALLTALLGAMIGGSLAFSAWQAMWQTLRVGSGSPLLRIPYWLLALVLLTSALLLLGAVIYRVLIPSRRAHTPEELAAEIVAAERPMEGGDRP